MTSPIYLDHNATTPMAPAVVEAMTDAMRVGYANPASQHEPGRQARRVVEAARQRAIELVGGQTGGRHPDRLVFTSGGTEANNLALFGLAETATTGTPPPHRLLTSKLEHPSVAAAAEQLERRGWHVDYLPVLPTGVADLAAVDELATDSTRLMSLMVGNNETGVLQPVAELAARCGERGIAIHTDAVQAVGKLDVSFRQLGVTAMSFTGHKFHGPLGIGGLLLRGDVEIRGQLWGGFQQAGIRPGTESVPLVVGLVRALELWHAERQERAERLARLRDRLEQQITAAVPEAVVVGGRAGRLPHTSNIAFRGCDRQALFMALDHAGVACSTGSACASGSSEPSPVLLAMGCEPAVVRGSLRLSLGAETTAAEVDEAARRILLAYKHLRQASQR